METSNLNKLIKIIISLANFFSKPQDRPQINPSSAVRLHQVARSIVIPSTFPPSTFLQGF